VVLAALGLKLVMVGECCQRMLSKNKRQGFFFQIPALDHLSLPWDAVCNNLLQGDEKIDKVPHTL
jgi:hypothetical protein